MRRLFVLFSIVLAACLPALAGPDDDAALKAKVAAPAAWEVSPRPPLRALTVRGLWTDMFNLEGALAHAGGAVVTESWTGVRNGGSSLRFYPDGYPELMHEHLIVICNVSAGAFNPVQRKMLKDFVDNGGSILFLGGYYAYGDYQGTAFEEMAPVTFDKSNYTSDPEGLPLVAAPGATGAELNWKAEPRVYWYHHVTPKPDARVLMSAGGKPMMIVGSHGKGRVAVFAGTVMGTPSAGQLPFWLWPDWAKALGDTVAWLTENSGHPDAAAGAALKSNFTTQLNATGGKRDPQDALMVSFATLCADKELARTLLETARSLDDLSPAAVDALIANVVPYADGGFADVAQGLIDSGATNKVRLGMCLLGRSKAPNATDVLSKALDSGDVDKPDAGAGGGDDTEDPQQRSFTIRLGAIQGLGDLGDAAAIPALQAAMTKYREVAAQGNFAKAPTHEMQLYNAASLGALQCGDGSAAPAALEAVLGMRYTFYDMIVTLESPVYPDSGETPLLAKKRVWREIGLQRERELQATSVFTTIPASALPALAKAIAASPDSHAAVIGLAAFGGRHLSPDVAAILSKSDFASVRDLAP